MNELALFAGAGGGILGGHLLGWRTICAVEWDAYAASVLVHRQNDGCLPLFPVWDDVQTFDGRPWRGRVDVISGGFPCQDISAAGKGVGIEGERSGMWSHMARIVGEIRPRYVFVENSPLLVGRGLARVLADLAEMGYAAKWGVVGAHHVAGCPHKRDRIWILGNSDSNGKPVVPVNDEAFWVPGMVANSAGDVADTQRTGLEGSVRPGEEKGSREASRTERPGEDVADSHGSGSRQDFKPSELRPEGSLQSPGHCGGADQTQGEEEPQGGEELANSCREGLQGATTHGEEKRSTKSNSSAERGGRGAFKWPTESDLGRGLPDGLAGRVDINGTDAPGGLSRVGKNIPHRADRLKCIGNGQVPQCAALAWKILTEQWDN